MVVSLPLKKNVCVGKPADEIGPGVVKKTKTHDENEDPWRKRRHITCKLTISGLPSHKNGKLLGHCLGHARHVEETACTVNLKKALQSFS